MNDRRSFFNLYSHNFIRVAVAIPQVLVAETEFNADQTIALMRQANERKALLVVFPELGLPAYSCEPIPPAGTAGCNRGCSAKNRRSLARNLCDHRSWFAPRFRQPPIQLRDRRLPRTHSRSGS